MHKEEEEIRKKSNSRVISHSSTFNDVVDETNSFSRSTNNINTLKSIALTESIVKVV